MPDLLIRAEGVSKKFCRRLRRSLWYGVLDMGHEFFARNAGSARLRKDEFWAVSDVSFTLRRGETIGLIGPNGAGKTTLLRMLNGLIKPDAGRIEISGRMQALIALGAGFNPILTGRENVYVNASVLGIPQADVRRRFDDIVDFADVREFIDSPVQNYSSGMAVRLGFAVSAFLQPDILLVDEVLAVGDEGFQMKCLNKIGELKQNGTGIILVSHNMHTISTYANSVLLLRKGRHDEYLNVSEGVREYRKEFLRKEDLETQKICSGNERICFHQVETNAERFLPGDTFVAKLHYESEEEFPDVEVDVAIYSSREPFLHFQATNKAYRRRMDLKKGGHSLEISVEQIRIHDAQARIAIAIWTNQRTELLFWWRIPALFQGMEHSTGNSFLNITFREFPENTSAVLPADDSILS
jgi:ABC-type polysaccharide/polyol phosphate transport system ATPase subunit